MKDVVKEISSHGQMKKFLIAIIALVYIGTSTGATLHMHYCMGKLADWGIGQAKPNACGDHEMAKPLLKKKSCCNDEEKIFKNATDQKISESSFQWMQLIAASLPASFIEIPFADFPVLTEENPVCNAPPPNSAVPVYLRDCAFLI